MPAGVIADNTKLDTLSVTGSHLSLHVALKAAIEALPNNTLIHSVDITRLAHGNNFLGVVMFELP
tara:strand:- start:17462 stop:17656 length:195 start_codon:yes stop_codon:yes gene_type:complete